MKTCPVCHISYADEAEYCKKCNALLLKKEDTPPAKYDGKRILTAVLSTFGFMLFIAGLYYLLHLFFS